MEAYSKALSPIRSCPACGATLERGFIYARSIRWDTARHAIRATWIGEPCLLAPFSLRNRSTPALKCSRCRIAIFDYGASGRLFG